MRSTGFRYTTVSVCDDENSATERANVTCHVVVLPIYNLTVARLSLSDSCFRDLATLRMCFNVKDAFRGICEACFPFSSEGAAEIHGETRAPLAEK